MQRKSFTTLSIADQEALRIAASRFNAQISEIYTRPRPSAEWEKRAKIAGNLLYGQTEVLDIGCGSMSVRRHLVPSVKYQGVDIVARGDDTIVVDLNKEDLPETGFRTACALGVMEYLYDPDYFLRTLRQFDTVLLSYCVRNLKLSRVARIKRLWVNHLSSRELKAAVKAAGFEIKVVRWISFSERLYLLK